MKQPTTDRGYSREQYDAFGRYAEAWHALEGQCANRRGDTKGSVAECALAFADAYRACEALGMCEDTVDTSHLQPERPVTAGEFLKAVRAMSVLFVQGEQNRYPGMLTEYRAVVSAAAGPRTVACSAAFGHHEFGQPAERVLRKMVGAFEVLLRGCIQTVGGKPL